MKITTKKNGTNLLFHKADIEYASVSHIIDCWHRATPSQQVDNWYLNRNQAIQNVAKEYGYTIVQVASVVSLLSPMCAWELNWRYATEIIRAHSLGDYSMSAGFSGNTKKAYDALDNPTYSWVETPTNPKTTSFFNNLLLRNNTTTIDKIAACIAFGFGNLACNAHVATIYSEIESLYFESAYLLSVDVLQLQATTWLVAQQERKSTHKAIMNAWAENPALGIPDLQSLAADLL